MHFVSGAWHRPGWGPERPDKPLHAGIQQVCEVNGDDEHPEVDLYCHHLCFGHVLASIPIYEMP